MTELKAKDGGNISATRQLCQIGHSFICVAHFPTGFDPLSSDAIVRVFTSKKRNEIITI